jgi:ABC-type uncharacterized transport system permease subunit
MEERKENDPLIRIVKRDDLPFKKRLLVRSLCISSALFLCVILLWIIGRKNPFPAVGIIFSGTFGNQIKFWKTMQDAVLLLGIAVALTPAYEMRFWNVGAQGQVLMGALGCALVMIYGRDLSNAAVIILSILVSVALGALWGLIPALFKAKWNTNETLFTLMMNYIAIQLVSFCVLNWAGKSSSMGFINKGTKIGWFPTVGGNSVIIPLIVVLILVGLMFVYINYTKHGYEIKVIGESLNTARYTGIKVRWSICRTLLLSGALCGLVGFIYVSGIDHSISADTSGSFGFTAIIVCWLADFNPLIMIVFAFLIAFLDKGALNLKNEKYAPTLNEYSCELLIFILIISIMLAEFFIRYRLVFRKKKKGEEKTAGEKEAAHG